MNYLSVCSGIEAATVAWHGLGFTPIGFSEIEKFPSAVLAHHYPHVTNFGDMTRYEKWTVRPFQILAGGTPCQSFSVAGLRKGLHDPRGWLMLTFLEIAQCYRPQWVVWENVPGVLSSDGGKDFGSFLGALGELGYGWAYRVLDAQWFGVAQRRRRVFVVGCFGDQTRAAQVLFESESVCRNTPPSREKGEIFPTLPSRNSAGGGLGTDFDCDGGLVCASTSGSGYWREGIGALRARLQDSHENIVCMAHGQGGAEILNNLSPTLNCNHEQPIAIQGTQDPCVSDVSFAQGRNSGQENAIAIARRVRRLTPIECERLQGFPDGYTNIEWYECCKMAFEYSAGKYGCPNCEGEKKAKLKIASDSLRYKALGNSMAVPVMRWIGRRIKTYSKNHLNLFS